MRFDRGLLGALLAATSVLAFCTRHLQTAALGWDSAEYAWVIDAELLPHSPYIAYVLSARAFASLFDTPTALSLLSALSLLATIVIVGGVCSHVSHKPGFLPGLLGGVLFGFAPISLTQACIQEIYALQTLLCVAALCVATRAGWRNAVLAGVLFGTAVAVHSGSGS